MKVNEKACPRCAEIVKLDAVACKHCGYEFTVEELEAAQAKKKAQAKKSMFGCLGCGGLIAAVAIVGAIGGSTGGPSKASDKGSGSEALLANYRQVIELTKRCDPAIGAVGEAAKSGSSVAMYSAAKEGQARCQETWLAIGKLSPADGLPDAAQEKEKKALETCSSAYFLRQRAMETAMSVADGDAKASNIASLQDDLKNGQGGVMLCVAQYFEAATAAGIKPDALK